MDFCDISLLFLLERQNDSWLFCHRCQFSKFYRLRNKIGQKHKSVPHMMTQTVMLLHFGRQKTPHTLPPELSTITTAKQRWNLLAVIFKRPNLQSGASHYGSLTCQYIYTTLNMDPSRLYKAKLTSVKYISFPGLNVTFSRLLPCFFPYSCLQDSVIVPNANCRIPFSTCTQKTHERQRRSFRTKFIADPPSSSHILECGF